MDHGGARPRKQGWDDEADALAGPGGRERHHVLGPVVPKVSGAVAPEENAGGLYKGVFDLVFGSPARGPVGRDQLRLSGSARPMQRPRRRRSRYRCRRQCRRRAERRPERTRCRSTTTGTGARGSTSVYRRPRTRGRPAGPDSRELQRSTALRSTPPARRSQTPLRYLACQHPS